jgi:hypothetical protein
MQRELHKKMAGNEVASHFFVGEDSKGSALAPVNCGEIG